MRKTITNMVVVDKNESSRKNYAILKVDFSRDFWYTAEQYKSGKIWIKPQNKT